MNLRIGIYDHLGWAIAVATTLRHDAVDRRRIQLIEPGVPCMPIHHPGRAQTLGEIATLVANVRASAERAVAASLRAMADELPGTVVSMHLRALSAAFPSSIAEQLRPPYSARADAIMYRTVLAAAAEARGWIVTFYEAKTAEADAASLLGTRSDEVLRGPRERFGAPWTKDHRTALAATVLA